MPPEAFAIVDAAMVVRANTMLVKRSDTAEDFTAAGALRTRPLMLAGPKAGR
jgi:hypothetical protein